jgi:hypothetical protein
MSERCEGPSQRARAYTENEPRCEPTAEQSEEAKIRAERAADQAAEARRNAYYASGGDEGGRSYRRTSDASQYPRSSPDDPGLKEYRRTKALDPPLQPDPLGNAIVAALAGGAIAGVGAAAGKVTVESAAAAAGEAAAAKAAGKLATEAAKTAAREAFRASAAGVGLGEVGARPSEGKPATSAVAAPAGMSSPDGASAPAPGPTQSVAPVRIPEAHLDATPVRLRG